jgi:hypothetical protein
MAVTMRHFGDRTNIQTRTVDIVERFLRGTNGRYKPQVSNIRKLCRSMSVLRDVLLWSVIVVLVALHLS